MARLEREARDRVALLEAKLNKTVGCASDFAGGLEEFQLKLKEETDDKLLLEDAITELETKLKESEEDNKASELLVEAISEKNKELGSLCERLKENMAVVEEDNQNMKEYVDNLRNDIDSLLKLSSRARDTGLWDPHDLSFCEVTFEQVFGGQVERPQEGVAGDQEQQEKVLVARSAGSSRSSLRSELSELARRQAGGADQSTTDLSSRSEASTGKIRELRQQVLRLQRKGSDHVKEVVGKDKLIAELQGQITELDSEKDELQSENNANLSVIQRLKENLADARTRLSSLEEESSSGEVGGGAGRGCSTASLPEMAAGIASSGGGYTSKFARSLTRHSSQTSLVHQLTDQLDLARREKRQLEQQLRQLLAQAEIASTEKVAAEAAVTAGRAELAELRQEHTNLKDDFRTLVRKVEERRVRCGEVGGVAVSRTKLLHEAARGQEALAATEERLESAILVSSTSCDNAGA